MADVTVKSLEEFDTAYGGAMKRVRAGLGVTSFGMQVFDLPPKLESYPGARPLGRPPGRGLHRARG